jgi:hypothetical protein
MEYIGLSSPVEKAAFYTLSSWYIVYGKIGSEKSQRIRSFMHEQNLV